MLNRPIIDPLNMSSEDEKILAHFLQGISSEQRISHRKQHYRHGGSFFKLKYDIIAREKMKGVWRFYVIDINDIGSGRYGAVFKRLARLHFDPVNSEELIVKREYQDCSRLYKKQQYYAESEYANMKQCPHLQTREFLRGYPNFISMRHFEGHDLYRIIEDDLNGKQVLTIAERFEITVQLLRAMQDQISDWMMEHLDIKPNNIKYDHATKQAFIFDLGAGHQAGHWLDKRSNGHSRYSAPEVYTSAEHDRPITYYEYQAHSPTLNKSTAKSDLFSMALVISLIWRNNDPLLLEECGGVKNRMNIRTYNNWVSYLNLFHGIKESVSREMQSSIYKQLCAMTAVKPENRPSTQECINFFEDLYLSYRFNDCELINEELVAAHRFGLSCYAEMRHIKRAEALLRKIRTIDDTGLLKPSDTIRSCLNKLSKKWLYKYSTLYHQFSSFVADYPLDEEFSLNDFRLHLRDLGSDTGLRECVLGQVSRLPNEHGCLDAFLHAAGIRCFIGVESNKELTLRITKLFDDFASSYKDVVELLAELKERLSDEQAKPQKNDRAINIYTYLIDDLTHFFKKVEKKPMTIDWIYRLNTHCFRKYSKTDKILQELAASQQQPAEPIYINK